MRIVFGVLVGSFLVTGCSTAIYVVRHAEKQLPATNRMVADPPLSAEGKERALMLATTLQEKKITAIYATPYQRTQQTAQPLSDAAGFPVTIYAANKGDALVDSLAKRKGKTYLVIGHSNTVPGMLVKLGLHPSVKEIPENDYDNFYHVRVKWFFKRSIRLTEKTYGKVSP